MASAPPTGVIRIRPLRRLLAQGTAATVALMIPVVVVLYWLAHSRGGVIWVLAFAAAVVVVYLVALVLYLRVQLLVGPTTIVEKPFLGRTREIRFDQVHRAIVLEMHRTMTVDARPQLFALDVDGHVMLRMRGEYWRRSDIETVTERLNTVVEVVPKPVTLSELQETNPQMLFWFERRPGFKN
ncbi:MAG: hypothetical protein ACTJHU_02190 [Mycetocola sp.]